MEGRKTLVDSRPVGSPGSRVEISGPLGLSPPTLLSRPGLGPRLVNRHLCTRSLWYHCRGGQHSPPSRHSTLLSHRRHDDRVSTSDGG